MLVPVPVLQVQRWSTKLATFGGGFILVGLLVWGASFDEYAVQDCADGEKMAGGDCPGKLASWALGQVLRVDARGLLRRLVAAWWRG